MDLDWAKINVTADPPVDNGILHIPPASDPAWLPGSRNWLLPYGVIIESITTVLLLIRILSRFSKLGGRIGIDDVLIVIGWLLGVGTTACCIYGAMRLGWNLHMLSSNALLWHTSGLVVLIAEHFFMFSLLCTKLSILMFYRRLVEGTYSKRFKYALWFGMFLVVVSTFVPMILLWTSCYPFKAIWMQWDATWVIENAYHFQCRTLNVMEIVARLTGSLSVITDFYSVMLPAIVLVRMQINNRQRWGLIAIFSVGYFVIAAGCVRTYYLVQAEGPLPDKSWNLYTVWVASLIECNVSIICACAPSLKSVFGKFFRDIASKENSAAYSSTVSGVNIKTRTDITYSTRDSELLSSPSMTYQSPKPRFQFSFKRTRPRHFNDDLATYPEAHENEVGQFSPGSDPYSPGPITRFDSSSSHNVNNAGNGPLHAEEPHPGVPAFIFNVNATSPPNYAEPGTRSPRRNAAEQDQPGEPSASTLAVPPMPRAANSRRTPGSRTLTSDDHSSTPSFIFIDREDGEDRIMRARYRGYFDSRNSSYEELSFPHMNPVISRTQSLKDAAELTRQMALAGASSHRYTNSTQSQPAAFRATNEPFLRRPQTAGASPANDPNDPNDPWPLPRM